MSVIIPKTRCPNKYKQNIGATLEDVATVLYGIIRLEFVVHPSGCRMFARDLFELVLGLVTVEEVRSFRGYVLGLATVEEVGSFRGYVLGLATVEEVRSFRGYVLG